MGTHQNDVSNHCFRNTIGWFNTFFFLKDPKTNTKRVPIYLSRKWCNSVCWLRYRKTNKRRTFDFMLWYSQTQFKLIEKSLFQRCAINWWLLDLIRTIMSWNQFNSSKHWTKHNNNLFFSLSCLGKTNHTLAEYV